MPIASRQIITLKLQKFKINLTIIVMINILLIQSLAADVFNERLARGNLVTKTDFDNIISSLNNKTAANKTKNESVENQIKNFI